LFRLQSFSFVLQTLTNSCLHKHWFPLPCFLHIWVCSHMVLMKDKLKRKLSYYVHKSTCYHSLPKMEESFQNSKNDK
jgi:hypothetical protein